jgi:hypothetical protein
MACVMVWLGIAVASVLLQLLSPWWWRIPVASNWGHIDDPPILGAVLAGRLPAILSNQTRRLLWS